MTAAEAELLRRHLRLARCADAAAAGGITATAYGYVTYDPAMRKWVDLTLPK